MWDLPQIGVCGRWRLSGGNVRMCVEGHIGWSVWEMGIEWLEFEDMC